MSLMWPPGTPGRLIPDHLDGPAFCGRHHLVMAAAHLAQELHFRQCDAAGRPYVTGHLLDVATRTALAGGTPLQVAIAWLHDSREDTPLTWEVLAQVIGEQGANIVDDLTHRPGEPRREYISRATRTLDGTMVKLSDNASNGDPGRLARVADAARRERLAAKYAREREWLLEAAQGHGISTQ